ncbi:universal stress protein [Klebsiella michiganensis]|nr:universal stress protein [Klebsiella michiganensis]
MSVYHHALVLINSSLDGVPLLAHAAKMAEEKAMRITIAHISTDYRSLNYVSDSLLDDDVSREVIQAKALLNELATTVALPVQTLSLVTTRRFADVEACVRQRNIDLIIAGHHNRLLGVLASHSLEYINHLTVDVLIKHLP